MTLPDAPKNRKINWTDEEWATYAQAVRAELPPETKELPNPVPFVVLNAAILALPEARRRTMYSNANAKLRPRLEIEFNKLPPLVPPEPEPAPDKERKAKVFWKDHEFLAMARELYRLNPHDTYLKSETLAGLTLAEVLEAQRVLPLERRRNLKQVSRVRAEFLEAFKVIRAEQEVKESVRESAQALQAEEGADARALAEKRQHIIDHPEAYSAPLGTAPRPEPVPEPVAAPEAPNVHKIALEVLVEMLVPALAQKLIPELSRQLSQLMTGAPAAAPKPEPEHIDDPLEHGPPADWTPPDYTMPSTTPRAAPVERKPVIGVLGLKPVQVQELKEAFPLLEFNQQCGTHSTKTLKALQSADRIISINSMANNMNQLTDKMLAKSFGDRYVRIQGGMSMAKRQIQIWIQAGVLK